MKKLLLPFAMLACVCSPAKAATDPDGWTVNYADELCGAYKNDHSIGFLVPTDGSKLVVASKTRLKNAHIYFIDDENKSSTVYRDGGNDPDLPDYLVLDLSEDKNWEFLTDFGTSNEMHIVVGGQEYVVELKNSIAVIGEWMACMDKHS